MSMLRHRLLTLRIWESSAAR